MDTLFSLREVAERLDVTYATILRYKKNGFIRTIRIGGTYKVTADEMRRLQTQGNWMETPPGVSPLIVEDP